MPIPEEPAALAYIEKTLADSYRKEIDQEENVWRSLPFFAATLALQLAALFQMIDKLPDMTTILGRLSILCLGIAALSTLVSLGFLAASIYPQKFDYIAKQTALLDYARVLILDEQAPENLARPDPFNALVTLKTEIARQYAQATDNNQQINKRRERRRSIAGLAALCSVLMTVFVVGPTYAHYIQQRLDKDNAHAASQSIDCSAPGDGIRDHQTGRTDKLQGPGPAPNAGGH